MAEPHDGMDVIRYRLDRAEAEIRGLHEDLDKRASEEKARLVWGISVLGGAVMTLATVIWNWRSVIFKGTP